MASGYFHVFVQTWFVWHYMETTLSGFWHSRLYRRLENVVFPFIYGIFLLLELIS